MFGWLLKRNYYFCGGT